MDVLLLRELLHDTGLPAVRRLARVGVCDGRTEPSTWEFGQNIRANVKKQQKLNEYKLKGEYTTNVSIKLLCIYRSICLYIEKNTYKHIMIT